MSRLFLVISILTVILWACATHAQRNAIPKVQPVVVLLTLADCCTEEAWPEAEARVALEFRQLGIKVITEPAIAQTERDRRIELIDAAEQHNAAAAIRIVKPEMGERAGVELWITDRVTQKTVYRYIPLNSVNALESAFVAALKTVELFKGSLQEIHMKPKQPVPEPIKSISKPPTRQAFYLGIGFGGTLLFADTGVRSAPSLYFGWNPPGLFQIELEGRFANLGAELKQDGYTAEMYINSALMKALFAFAPGKPVKPSLGAIMGATIIRTDGDSADATEENIDRMTAFYVGGCGAVHFDIGNDWQLGFLVDAGTFMPEAAIIFGSSEIARIGAPVVHGAIQLNRQF